MIFGSESKGYCHIRTISSMKDAKILVGLRELKIDIRPIYGKPLQAEAAFYAIVLCRRKFSLVTTRG